MHEWDQKKSRKLQLTADMNEIYFTAVNIIWLILISYWFISGIKAKKSVHKESYLKQFVFYWFPIIFAVYVLGPDERFGNSLLKGHFIPHTDHEGLLGLGLQVSGLIIACWSRYILGKNWSVSVQKKEDHKLITTGPYSLVRHPIYSGLLLMFLGNAIIVGKWRGLIGVLILFISFLFKLKKEEKWLSESFGQEYAEYMKKSSALIPWLI
jgi:protein-S-isoprenylcysteine O-methyltransferase Ste14